MLHTYTHTADGRGEWATGCARITICLLLLMRFRWAINLSMCMSAVHPFLCFFYSSVSRGPGTGTVGGQHTLHSSCLTAKASPTNRQLCTMSVCQPHPRRVGVLSSAVPFLVNQLLEDTQRILSVLLAKGDRRRGRMNVDVVQAVDIHTRLWG